MSSSLPIRTWRRTSASTVAAIRRRTWAIVACRASQGFGLLSLGFVVELLLRLFSHADERELL